MKRTSCVQTHLHCCVKVNSIVALVDRDEMMTLQSVCQTNVILTEQAKVKSYSRFEILVVLFPIVEICGRFDRVMHSDLNAIFFINENRGCLLVN